MRKKAGLGGGKPIQKGFRIPFAGTPATEALRSDLPKRKTTDLCFAQIGGFSIDREAQNSFLAQSRMASKVSTLRSCSTLQASSRAVSGLTPR